VASKDGVQSSKDTTTYRPITYNTYDNLDEVTQVQRYDGDGVTITSTNGVPNAPSASLLRAQTKPSYDEQGRVYQTVVYDVNQSTGVVSSSGLTTNTYYNHRGQVIETSQPGGLVDKKQYDGADRVTEDYQTDGGNNTSWSNASSVASDNVLEQTDTQYDKDGNAILVSTRQRFDNETTKGALGNPTTAPKARVSYVASYYDAANRLTATVDVGTNGGSAYTRPGTVPSFSATVLVTTESYNAAGWLQDEVDPRGLDNRTSYDNLGRTTQTIEDYTNGTPTATSNKTSNYTYDGSNHTLTLQAVETGGASETTKWIYGVTTSTGSNLNSNDILATVQYPDPSTGAPSSTYQDSYTVNALGDQLTYTDRAGNVHTYSYDVLGRQTSDAITTLASGFDNSVLRLQKAYDALGNAYLLTSYNAASGGSIVNQVQQVYNGLDQLIQEYQSHSGAVNTSSTPSVQYAYNELAGGTNNSRLLSMTYPNGRVLNFNYNTGVDNTISRLSSISDSSATLESYKYLGLSTVVERDHPQTTVNLTYISQSGGTGDAGDQYTELDRFGRVVDQNWYNTTTSSSTDDFQYSYDQDGNPLYKNNTVSSSFSELYHASGAGNGYDGLNQLSAFARGTLSASQQGGPLDTVASPSTTESWSYDAMGNFSSVTLNSVQTNRTHNQQNEVTGVGSNNLAFDKNGNTTTDDQGHTLKYDAWNRLVSDKNGGTTLELYSYDPLGRRITENPGTLRDLYFSSAWQLVEEDVSGSMQDQYVWSSVYVDALVERDTPSQRLYVQQDANWNSTALITTSGTVVERYVYDPYGAVTYLTASWGTRSGSAYSWVYLHQAGRWDAATALYNFRHRDYSPSLGRWVAVDPSGFQAGDTNLYRDTVNAPIRVTDPSGLGPDWSWWWNAIKATPGAIKDTFVSGEAWDSLQGATLQMIDSTGLTHLQQNVPPLYGHQDAYDGGRPVGQLWALANTLIVSALGLGILGEALEGLLAVGEGGVLVLGDGSLLVSNAVTIEAAGGVAGGIGLTGLGGAGVANSMTNLPGEPSSGSGSTSSSTPNESPKPEYMPSAEARSRPPTRPGTEPRDVPHGTRPINEHPSTSARETVHRIKENLKEDGVGPKSYVGISPEGDIIVTNPDGTHANLEPWQGYDY
jgi:RHS repeat-associated protein